MFTYMIYYYYIHLSYLMFVLFLNCSCHFTILFVLLTLMNVKVLNKWLSRCPIDIQFLEITRMLSKAFVQLASRLDKP